MTLYLKLKVGRMGNMLNMVGRMGHRQKWKTKWEMSEIGVGEMTRLVKWEICSMTLWVKWEEGKMENRWKKGVGEMGIIIMTTAGS